MQEKEPVPFCQPSAGDQVTRRGQELRTLPLSFPFGIFEAAAHSVAQDGLDLVGDRPFCPSLPKSTKIPCHSYHTRLLESLSDSPSVRLS